MTFLIGSRERGLRDDIFHPIACMASEAILGIQKLRVGESPDREELGRGLEACKRLERAHLAYRAGNEFRPGYRLFAVLAKSKMTGLEEGLCSALEMFEAILGDSKVQFPPEELEKLQEFMLGILTVCNHAR